MSKKILVLYAHPAQGRSEVNREMAKAAQSLDCVTLVDLYNTYPDYFIDVEAEQKRLLEHDIIIFLHPMYWYSTPAILKEWQDLVLEYGFAYGKEGDRLHGKIFFSTLSAGGGEEAYMRDGYNHFTVRELLAPLEQTAGLCGMIYLPPYVLFSSRQAYEDDRITGHAEKWIALLEDLSADRIDLDAAGKLPLLNQVKIKERPAKNKMKSTATSRASL